MVKPPNMSSTTRDLNVNFITKKRSTGNIIHKWDGCGQNYELFYFSKENHILQILRANVSMK